MIKSKREQDILAMLEDSNIVSVRELYAALSDVAPVTVRRDIARLAREGKLVRVRGGIRRKEPVAARPGPAAGGPSLGTALAEDIAADLDLHEFDDARDLQRVDVIVLPPIDARAARTLRHAVRRSGVFCLDESSPDGEGTYVGVDNDGAGCDVGRLAGREREAARGARLDCLVVGQDSLAGTRDRIAGFMRGLRESFPGGVDAIGVGGGIYFEAFRQTRDALSAFPHIGLVFATTDHSMHAALDAARSLQRTDIAIYGVGGEGAPIFEELERNDLLRGFAAMFPEVVARSAVNAMTRYFAARRSPPPVITPHRVLTPANLSDCYERREGRWQIRPALIEELTPLLPAAERGPRKRHSVLFVLNYPPQDWQRTLSAQMQGCCRSLGYEYHAASIRSQVRDVLHYTRREIAARAAQLVRSGDTIAINGGKLALETAGALRGQQRITVVTNSLPVLNVLAESPGIRVLLTGGVYRREPRSLAGPSVGSMLSNLRIDTALLSVDGLSTDFGASCADEEDAACVRLLAAHSRRSVVLADHSILGEDASYRALTLERIDAIVSDFGVPAQQRIDFGKRDIALIIAGDARERPSPEGREDDDA